MKRLNLQTVELRKVGFCYDPEARIFEELSFNFKEKEVIYIQGPRGSGKNTLISILLGLLPPTEGDYLVNGTKVNDFSYKEFDPYRLNIGHSFESGGLINNQTLYENFRLILDYHAFMKRDDRFNYIIKMFERFDLEDIKHLRPAFVSSGARKAASVLRAFALQPEMLILDNPSQGLGKEHIPALVKLIKDHQENHNLKFIFISSDDPELKRQLAGRVLNVTPRGLIEDGTLEACA